MSDDNWVDPCIAGSVMKPLSFDELANVRTNIDALITKSLSADVIFITLGLNEVWFDHNTECYLNGAPPPVLMRSDTERFEFIVPSYSETVEKIRSTILLLKSASIKDLKFIVTISPVPLATTWTAEDVVIANTQSKATLRVAAAELVREFDFVDYYPSYEMVVNSPKDLAWNDDYLHVKRDMIKFVIGNFVERYIQE